MLSITCPEPNCKYGSDYVFPSLTSLSVHWRKSHHHTAEELRLVLFHDGVRPTCKCGCGGAVKFLSIEQGFTEWIRGHVSRVHNNWGHNDVARGKSLETRRAAFADGAATWNSGLTKETDQRVAGYGAVQSANFTPERRDERSSTMIRSWQTGAITPLTGSAHSQWAGGVSALQSLCRSHLHMPWVRPKLIAAGFRCSQCGSSSNLCVHHDGERFSTILRAVVTVLGEPGDDFEKKDAIAEAVTQYHIDRDVSGIVLCDVCHAREHTADA